MHTLATIYLQSRVMKKQCIRPLYCFVTALRSLPPTRLDMRVIFFKQLTQSQAQADCMDGDIASS